jgi:hypothetical protein
MVLLNSAIKSPPSSHKGGEGLYNVGNKYFCYLLFKMKCSNMTLNMYNILKTKICITSLFISHEISCELVEAQVLKLISVLYHLFEPIY